VIKTRSGVDVALNLLFDFFTSWDVWDFRHSCRTIDLSGCVLSQQLAVL
jgi:hypothetical protein